MLYCMVNWHFLHKRAVFYWDDSFYLIFVWFMSATLLVLVEQLVADISVSSMCFCAITLKLNDLTCVICWFTGSLESGC